MEIYEEREMRKLRGCTVVASLVSLNTDHKQWLFAVFNVSRYLCANSLPFRGTNESDIDAGDGLFLRAFSQLLFPLEEKWKKIHKNLPKNAKYTSPDIQNEVIEVLSSLVKNKIAEDIRKAELFTIMADGTTDKNRKEIQALVCRYLSSEGKVEEHCLNVKGIDDRSAKGVFNFIKETLAEFEISFNGLVSQSFDGASVMSGDYNGLQKLVSDFCDRYILYVHCFLHKIHLVVTFIVENIYEIKDYYGTITALYNFFKKSAVFESYDGTALKRLIETRWSGHYESTKHVNNNYGDLIQALLVASKNKKLSGEDKAQAIGRLNQMDDDENHSFAFINCMLMKVLKPIDIIVKQLQSVHENFISALEVIKSVKEEIKSERETVTDEKTKKMVVDFFEGVRVTTTNGEQRRPRRNTAISSRFTDFLVTENLPSENNRRPNIQIFIECLDLRHAEFIRRFSTENILLWEAMSALSPSSDVYLKYDILKPLFRSMLLRFLY